MVVKTKKRTYNLSESTIERVRELVGRAGAPGSQDGVVELAVERLYLEFRAKEEAALWSAAREDPEFYGESKEMARDYRDLESWPT